MESECFLWKYPFYQFGEYKLPFDPKLAELIKEFGAAKPSYRFGDMFVEFQKRVWDLLKQGLRIKFGSLEIIDGIHYSIERTLKSAHYYHSEILRRCMYQAALVELDKLVKEVGEKLLGTKSFVKSKGLAQIRENFEREADEILKKAGIRSKV